VCCFNLYFSREDSGIYAMMFLEYWKSPRTVLRKVLYYTNIPNLRIQFPNDLMFVPGNSGMKSRVVEFVDPCRCLNLSTSMGGTRSKVEGGDRHDLEPEGLREDTRHKIYTGSGSQSSYPTSCLEYCALLLDVDPRRDCGCLTWYPVLLYIVQGAGS
jgi:hypothetical protein